MSDIEKYEGLIAELARKRDACAQRGVDLSDERAAVALAAHTGDAKAAKRLADIHNALALHSSEIASLDAAVKAAGEKLATAERAKARAADQQRAAEARELVREFSEVFPYLDRKLAEAASALIAINNGIARLHAAGFAFPTDAQARLGITAIIQTWAHRLPRSWHDQLRDGFEFLAPGRRQTAVEYWAQIQASINNQITQRLDKTDQPNKERAA